MTGLMYSVSYVRSDASDTSTRAVTFLFYGGPGSASMWLHMGSVGPKRVATTNGQYTPPAPDSINRRTVSGRGSRLCASAEDQLQPLRRTCT